MTSPKTVEDSRRKPTEENAPPPWNQNKPLNLVSTILGNCLCNDAAFRGGGSGQSSQFLELHGVQFIGLGAVADELTPKERVYDTLEQLTTRTERLVSIGYLVDKDTTEPGEYNKVTETVPLDIWNKAYPTDNSMSKRIQSLIRGIKEKDYVGVMEDLRREYDRQKAHPNRSDNRFMVGITAHNIGVVYVLAGRDEKAMPFFQEAVALKRAAFGEEHPEVAFSLDEVGIQLFAKGQFEESLAAFKESQRIRTRAFGPSGHLTIAMVLNNIACCNFSIGNHLAALVTLQEARDIQQHVMGSAAKADLDLLHAAITLSNFGYLKLQLKQYDDARAVFEEALLLQQSVLGDAHNHRAIRDTRSNIEFTNAFHSL